MDFDCKACGACCRAIGCIYLDQSTNRCKVYEDRPDFCRVGFSRPADMPVADYIEQTHKACKVLEKVYGTSPDSPRSGDPTSREDHQNEQGRTRQG